MKKLLLALLAAATAHATPWADHLGIQLWSLHKTLDVDPVKGLDEVKTFGLTDVETAGTYTLTTEKFHEELKARGLKVISAHFQYDDLKKDLQGKIADAKILGAKYVVVPWIPHDRFDVSAARKAAEDFNVWGAAFKKAGIQFGWHPHGFEFGPAENGTTPFEVIANSTDPKNVIFEMDVFWVEHAGLDPVALLKKYPDRFRLMHVKDMRKGTKTGFFTGKADVEANVAVGSGVTDWPALLKTAHQIGVKYYFIEDETSDPITNVPVSVAYMRSVK